MGLAKEGLEAKGMEVVMPGELRAVVEGDGLPPGRGQGSQEAGHGLGDRSGRLAGGPGGQQEAGVAFMEGEDSLAVDSEQHQIGLPVARCPPVRDGGGPLSQRAAQGDEGGRAPAFIAAAPPFRFRLGEIVAPGVLFFAGDLGIDEAVDGFVRDNRPVLVHGEAAGHLLGRPAALEVRQDGGAERGVAVQLGALPAARPGLLVGIAGLIVLGRGAIALQFPSHGRWRAIQSCRNLADRVSRGV